ncbi:MAG: DUF6428 family protein [Flavobacteriaceae bacterium]|nr:DUF6428 family protein [Flavobacteriaceae bacterium]
MTLSEIKNHLKDIKKIGFQLPDGSLVPSHFHVTEVGKITKNFIDCGGTLRHEEIVNFQLWNANDYDHRLRPEKLIEIIALSEEILKIKDLEIEVEYQGATIGKYGLDFDGTNFLLINSQTDCLAKDNCGIPEEKQKVVLSAIETTTSSCDPSSGCC